jgi:hypothetical protein
MSVFVLNEHCYLLHFILISFTVLNMSKRNSGCPRKRYQFLSSSWWKKLCKPKIQLVQEEEVLIWTALLKSGDMKMEPAVISRLLNILMSGPKIPIVLQSVIYTVMIWTYECSTVNPLLV